MKRLLKVVGLKIDCMQVDFILFSTSQGISRVYSAILSVLDLFILS